MNRRHLLKLGAVSAGVCLLPFVLEGTAKATKSSCTRLAIVVGSASSTSWHEHLDVYVEFHSLKKGDIFRLEELDGRSVDNGEICAATSDAFYDTRAKVWTVECCTVAEWANGEKNKFV